MQSRCAGKARIKGGIQHAAPLKQRPLGALQCQMSNKVFGTNAREACEYTLKVEGRQARDARGIL